MTDASREGAGVEVGVPDLVACAIGDALGEGSVADGAGGVTVALLEQPPTDTARRTVAIVAKSEWRGDGIGVVFPKVIEMDSTP